MSRLLYHLSYAAKPPLGGDLIISARHAARRDACRRNFPKNITKIGGFCQSYVLEQCLSPYALTGKVTVDYAGVNCEITVTESTIFE